MLTHFLCLIIVFNYSGAINYLKHRFPFFNELTQFYEFICENNPILLHYYDDECQDDNNKNDEDTQEQLVEQPKQILVKFEDKNLAKFKTFPNEFIFNEAEFKQENEEYEKIKKTYEKTRLATINSIQKKLIQINEIQELGNFSLSSEKYTENINQFGIDCLIRYHNCYEDDEFNVEGLYKVLLKDKEELLKKMDETEKMIMTEEEMRKKSREIIINKKLDNFINNYILEYTPLGNIYMRYNNDKKSFEYFSNNTIPYRYLESVCRKYVMTYWCKPIFVDIDEELKRAEVKFDECMQMKEAYKKMREEEMKNNPMKNNPKDVIARMKSYNNETKNFQQQMKNRTANNVLPPQIKANLPNVKQHSEKQLLKEQANRYTWEGRLTDFCPLKNIDKKTFDKNLTMSYYDFKRIQQEDKNKK